MTSTNQPPRLACDAFWEKLLPRTFAHCRKHPFYKEKWGTLADEPLERFEDLERLPTLDKDDMRRFFDLACEHGGDIGTLIHSSGTTGRPVYRMRSKNELQFIHRFFSRAYPSAEAAREGPAPLSLLIAVQDHGGSVSLPSGPPGLRISSWTEERLDEAIALLQAEHRLPGLTDRIVTLSCGTDILITLTLGILKRGVSPADFKLQAISMGGFPLTRARYDWLRLHWGCTMVDRWSCSEVFGSATRLHPDGAFIFDTNVVTELVDPQTGAALTYGTGLLALTELVPFSQMQTLVRFTPGDLFQAVWSEDGGRAFRFRGRTADSVMDPDGRLILAALDIFEVLHQFPEIVRWNDADMGDLLSWGRAVDPPQYQAVFETGTRLNLTFACSFDPDLFPEAARRTRLSIEEALKTTSPELAGAMEQCQLTISIALKNVKDMAAFSTSQDIL